MTRQKDTAAIKGFIPLALLSIAISAILVPWDSMNMNSVSVFYQLGMMAIAAALAMISIYLIFAPIALVESLKKIGEEEKRFLGTTWVIFLLGMTFWPTNIGRGLVGMSVIMTLIIPFAILEDRRTAKRNRN